MGNCLNSINNLSILNQFKNYYILDDKYPIILGIYQNTNSITMLYQGICIGNNNIVNKIVFGIFHNNTEKILNLFFENNISLTLKNNITYGDKIKLTLKHNNSIYEKFINVNLIKELKLIENNSEDINLIFKIIK